MIWDSKSINEFLCATTAQTQKHDNRCPSHHPSSTVLHVWHVEFIKHANLTYMFTAKEKGVHLLGANWICYERNWRPCRHNKSSGFMHWLSHHAFRQLVISQQVYTFSVINPWYYQGSVFFFSWLTSYHLLTSCCDARFRFDRFECISSAHHERVVAGLTSGFVFTYSLTSGPVGAPLESSAFCTVYE